MIIAVIILLFIGIGFIGYITVKKIKETDPNNIENTLKQNVKTVQEFLPFENIKDNVIDLGQHQYRAIIKCNSINYRLKTDKEKLVIEASYQRFLNSLMHPISIFIQTKTMDNSRMLKNLKADIEKSIEDFPVLSNYGESFYSEMTDIYERIGNNKEKNKYIIVPYNEAITLSDLTDDEKYEYSIKELQSRCQIIIDNLQGIGISSNMLNTTEVLELVYSNYHKDNLSQFESIANGEFLTMTVKGEDKLSKVTDEGRLDWILYEAQLRLETELVDNKAIKDNLKERSMDAINEISKIREALAGEYQYIFNIEDKMKNY